MDFIEASIKKLETVKNVADNRFIKYLEEKKPRTSIVLNSQVNLLHLFNHVEKVYAKLVGEYQFPSDRSRTIRFLSGLDGMSIRFHKYLTDGLHFLATSNSVLEGTCSSMAVEKLMRDIVIIAKSFHSSEVMLILSVFLLAWNNILRKMDAVYNSYERRTMMTGIEFGVEDCLQLTIEQVDGIVNIKNEEEIFELVFAGYSLIYDFYEELADEYFSKE